MIFESGVLVSFSTVSYSSLNLNASDSSTARMMCALVVSGVNPISEAQALSSFNGAWN